MFSFDRLMKYLQGFNQCVSMTDATLCHDCDIDNTVPYNLHILNSLFAIIDNIYYIGRHASARKEVLKYLLKTEYDMKQRNDRALTLLFCVATVLTPSVIKFLKILTEKGAEIHAVDARGYGALHCALAEPQFC